MGPGRIFFGADDAPCASRTRLTVQRRGDKVSSSIENHSLRELLGLTAFLAALVGGAGMGFPASTAADVPPAQQAEVQHLLEFIRTTPCRLERNGREYGGERAHRHVLRKYDYFRERIETTEDFIALSASQSTISGRPYWFLCDGEPRMESRAVLLAELRRYREAQD
jgi:hypothetical protein